MLFAMVLLLTIGCIAFVLVRAAQGGPRPDGLRGRVRDRGWGLLLLPVAMSAAAMAGGAHGLIPAELGLAVLAIVFAPKLAARLVPYGVLGLAIFGVMLARMYNDGFANRVQYLFVHAGWGTWGTPPVLAEAALLFVAGLWLLVRLDAPGAGPVRALAARWLDRGRGGISAVQALLLIPVAGLTMQLLGPGNWFGVQAVDGLDAAVIDLALLASVLVLIFRSRAWAATLATAGLLVLGAYGWVVAVFWPVVPGFAYGFSDLHNSPMHAVFWGVALQASILLASGLWLAPRVTRQPPGRLARPRARGPGPAADPAGADADPDPPRRRGHRGRRAAPHRARPARRGAGPAGRARHEPAGGRTAVPDQSRGGARARGRGQGVPPPWP